MRYFRKNTTDSVISLDDIRNQYIIESQMYQDYLRKNAIDTEEKIIVMYKKVGKKVELRKIRKSLEEFRKLLGGEIEILSLKGLNDIFIICRKYRDNLKPNVYFNISFGVLDETIRGDLLVTAKNLRSLTKEQVLKYGLMITKESYYYNRPVI